LTAEARTRLATRLAMSLYQKLSISPDFMANEDFIEEVDRQYKVQSKYFS